MKNSSQKSLIALNVVLLVIFAAVSFVPTTEAQTTRSKRYIAVPARINGLTPGVLYIMDTTQQELVAVTWDHNTNRITPLGYRPVASDIATALRN